MGQALKNKELMSIGDAGGSVVRSCGEDSIDISVRCLNGEGCVLKLFGSCTGQEVHRMASKELPAKKGGKVENPPCISLHHLDSPLILHKALHEQGMVYCGRFTGL